MRLADRTQCQHKIIYISQHILIDLEEFSQEPKKSKTAKMIFADARRYKGGSCKESRVATFCQQEIGTPGYRGREASTRTAKGRAGAGCREGVTPSRHGVQGCNVTPGKFLKIGIQNPALWNDK